MDARTALTTAHRVTRAITTAESFTQVCDEILACVTEHLSADRSSLLLADAAGEMRFRAWRGLSDAYRAATEGHSPWDIDEVDARPVLVPNVATYDGLGDLRDVVLREGIRALVFVPLRGKTTLLGKFMIYYDHPRELGEEDLLLARILADQAAFALARFRAEEQATKAHEDLVAVLASVSDGITVQRPDGRLEYANDAAAHLCGLRTGDELVAAPPSEVVSRYTLITEDGTPANPEQIPGRRALLGVRSSAVLGYRPTAGGEIRWSRVASQPCLNSDGSVRFAVTVISDVTRVRRDADMRRFLLESSRLLAASLDIDETLARILQLAVSRMADWCTLAVYGDEGPPRLLVAHADPAKLALAETVNARFEPVSEARRQRALRSGQPELSAVVTEEMIDAVPGTDEDRRLLRELGVCSSLIVPLRSRGVTLGTLSLAFAESGRHFDEEDVVVASKLADRAATAIDNARLFRQAREEHERLSVTLASIGDAVIATDAAGRITILNAVAESLTGFSAADALGRPLSEVFDIYSERTGLPVASPVQEVLRHGRIVGLANHTVLVARDGTRRSIADSAAPIRDARGGIVGVVLVFRDVTHQERVEAEMARASKLQSIGVLAGGIAHDFNNILTSIVANLSLAEHRLSSDHPARTRVAAATSACARAKDLTRQLLTFARGGAPVKSPTTLSQVLEEASGFALQGANVRAEFRIAPDLWPADADAGQISQVVHNLVLNASQAMPDGGTLAVEAENVVLDDQMWLPLPPGRYVRFRVIDHGVGIAHDDLARIFDPFYTTKPAGSGLGLTTTWSVVRRHDGHIGVESALGKGTTFTVHLPVAAAEPLPPEPVQPRMELGRGRVLLMDDDLGILDLAGECLRELGYEPETAVDGALAIQRYAEAIAEGRSFDAVILDLTVPGGLGGCETLRRLRERFPDVRAIVSSGYSNDPVMAAYRDHGFRGVIQKPYDLDDLARVLHGVLAEG